MVSSHKKCHLHCTVVWRVFEGSYSLSLLGSIRIREESVTVASEWLQFQVLGMLCSMVFNQVSVKVAYASGSCSDQWLYFICSPLLLACCPWRGIRAGRTWLKPGTSNNDNYGIVQWLPLLCGYLTVFHTVYVMVDNRDLANHQRKDSSLPHWQAAARWWHSRLKLIGPHKEKTELLLFPISASTGLHHMCTPPGLAPLFLQPWWLYFMGSTSYCWTVTAYRLLCFKLKTCGQRPTWRVFQPIVKVAFHRHTLCEPSHVSAKTLRLSTLNLGLVVLEWVKRLWSSQNRMP